jgi:hypothetical protein
LLEPDFESGASTSSAIPARLRKQLRAKVGAAGLYRMPLTPNDFEFDLPEELIAQSGKAFDPEAVQLLLRCPKSGNYRQ